MPSKNEISSAKVAQLARDGGQYGAVTGPVTVDMATVRLRKREMVKRQIAKHLQIYRASGAQLLMGIGRFAAPKTLEVKLNEGGTRLLATEKVFLDVGTHAAIPHVPGLEAARPLTHVEALELDYLPHHLIVVGGGRLVLMGGVGMLGGDDLALPYPWIMRNCVTIHGQWMYPPTAVPRIAALARLRLRGPSGARDEFLLAATAQNLRKLAKLAAPAASPHLAPV